jgi:putative transposase
MKNRFTEEQIIKAVTRFNNGERAKDLARELGVNDRTLYFWKKRFSGMTVNEAKKMKVLEAENQKLKKLVADLSLDNQMLREVNSRKW